MTIFAVNYKSVPTSSTSGEIRVCTCFQTPDGSTESMVIIVPDMNSFSTSGVEAYARNNNYKTDGDVKFYQCQDNYYDYKNNADSWGKGTWNVTQVGTDYPGQRLLIGLERDMNLNKTDATNQITFSYPQNPAVNVRVNFANFTHGACRDGPQCTW